MITLALALLGLLTTHPANALQADAWIDMSRLITQVTPLNSGNGILPVFTLSNRNSNASVYQNAYNGLPGGYFTIFVNGIGTSSPDWTTNQSSIYSPGAIGSAEWKDNVGTTGVNGYDDGFALFAYSTRSANFTLTDNTRVDIWIPVFQSVDPTGADPTLGSGVGREAYARTRLMVQSSSYEVLDVAYLERDHWTSGDLAGTLHVTFQNLTGSDMTGYLEALAFSGTMSYPAPPAADNTHLDFLGDGLNIFKCGTVFDVDGKGGQGPGPWSGAALFTLYFALFLLPVWLLKRCTSS